MYTKCDPIYWTSYSTSILCPFFEIKAYCKVTMTSVYWLFVVLGYSDIHSFGIPSGSIFSIFLLLNIHFLRPVLPQTSASYQFLRPVPQTSAASDQCCLKPSAPDRRKHNEAEGLGGWASTLFFSVWFKNFRKRTLDTMLVTLTVVTSCTGECKPTGPDKIVQLSHPRISISLLRDV